jgi:CRISPR-associated exonuclease Cas4
LSNPYGEDDLLPLSGLQHLVFCERQWGLIHLEQQWAENRLTAEGRLLHDRAHESGTEARGDLVTARGVMLASHRLGLSGQADVVEFRREEAESGLVKLPSRQGLWRPFPVEYKRGRPKTNGCDEIQLCAQALCLEEMTGAAIPIGALFYGEGRRRREVQFDARIRARTAELARRMHELYEARQTPAAQYAKKCESCSLQDRCMPRVAEAGTVARYLARAVREAMREA